MERAVRSAFTAVTLASQGRVNTTYDTGVDNPVGTALVELLTDQRRPAFAGVYIVEAASGVRAAGCNK